VYSPDYRQDINYLPGFEATRQLRSFTTAEYPMSSDLATVIRNVLSEKASLYENCGRLELDPSSNQIGVYDREGDFLGYPRRVIWAAGLDMTAQTEQWSRVPSVTTAESFLDREATRPARGIVAVVGGGDTAATLVEYLLGMGATLPTDYPREIHWFGGTSMKTSKREWAMDYHARYMGIARHLPQFSFDPYGERDESQLGADGIIRPYAVRGEIASIGDTALVNGRIFDTVYDATGFRPVTPIQPGASNTGRDNLVRDEATDSFIARTPDRYVDSSVSGLRSPLLIIGAAANLPARPLGPGISSPFAASKDAIYSLAPRTARLATVLP
jgi:hypothetical protein